MSPSSGGPAAVRDCALSPRQWTAARTSIRWALVLYQGAGRPFRCRGRSATAGRRQPARDHRLSDVIRKCLKLQTRRADTPGAAAGLAADLRRYLATSRLVGVANRSLAER